MKAEKIKILVPATFNAYLGVTEAFLKWTAVLYMPRVYQDAEIRSKVQEAKERIENAFRSHSKIGHSVPKSGLTKDEVKELIETVKPGSERNPFRQSEQQRNYLIILLLIVFGLRRGELLKIKMAHLPNGPKRTLTIERTINDPSDPREHEPRVKTLGRRLPVAPFIVDEIYNYMRFHRRRGRHPYLFTSHRDGQPLSSSTINWIFSRIGKAIPALKDRLHPHILRHTFNDNLVEIAEALGWDEEKLKKIQRSLNGWSIKSKMPEHYTRRTIEAAGLKVAEDYQNALYDEVF